MVNNILEYYNMMSKRVATCLRWFDELENFVGIANYHLTFNPQVPSITNPYFGISIILLGCFFFSYFCNRI